MRPIYTLRTLLFITLLFIGNVATAKQYETVKSGKLYDATTWKGGVIPPLVLAVGDSIIVPFGDTLILDTPIVASRPNSAVIINGVLNSVQQQVWPRNYNPLKVGDSAAFLGDGYINIDSLVALEGLDIGFEGVIEVMDLYSNGLKHHLAKTIVKIKTGGSLTLAKGDYEFTDGTIELGLSASVNLARGFFKTPSGSNARYDFSQWHFLTYTDTLATGPRSFGSEMKAGTPYNIDLRADVILKDDLFIPGLVRGNRLIMNGHDITFDTASMIQNLVVVPDTNASIIAHTKRRDQATLTLEYDRDIEPFYGIRNILVDVGDSTSRFERDREIDLRWKGTYGAPTLTDTLQLIRGHLNIGYTGLKLHDSNTVILGGDSSSYIRTQADYNVPLKDSVVKSAVSVPIYDTSTIFLPIGTKNSYAPARVKVHRKANPLEQRVSVGAREKVSEFGENGYYISHHDHLVNISWFAGFSTTHFKPYYWYLDSISFELMWYEDEELYQFNRNKSCIADAHYQRLLNPKPKWNKVPLSSAVQLSNGMYSQSRTFYDSTILGTLYMTIADTSSFLSVAKVLATQQDFVLYPNPVHDVLKFDYELEGDMNIQVLNTVGSVLRQQQLSQGVNTIDVASLPTGTYLVRFYNGEVNEVRRFVKH